jgi:mannose-1-phosphate guanylyltransferase/mannose-6-phosphate isomerase
MTKIQPVILAGGSGSRLWPLSREAYPKQLLRITGGRSLLQNTLSRLTSFSDIYPPIIVAGEEHYSALQNQLDELDIFDEYLILLEPLDKDTAPAVCGAAEYVRRYCDDNTIMLVLPSDHLIEEEDEFVKAVEQALELALEGYIVSLGVTPAWPEVGYGYIEAREDGTIISFKEKPQLEVARRYLASGNYYWNSGILVFNEKTFSSEMIKYAGNIHSAMVRSVELGALDGRVYFLEQQSMATLDGISIDYALIEHINCGAMVLLNAQWKDVGTWQAFWHLMERDGDGNVFKGDVIADDTSNSLVISEDKLVAVIGLRDAVVVETSDAVLVSSMADVQKVKKVVERLKKADRKEFHDQVTVHRPWGARTALMAEQNCKIQRVSVLPKASLALQKHFHRHEYWIVVHGTAQVTSGKDIQLLSENQSTLIPAGVVHRLENPGTITLELIEIQLGEYLGEDDVVYYND